MKTTLRVSAMVALAVLLVAAPGQTALQGGPGEKGTDDNAFKVYGQIVSLDSEGGSIKIDVNAPDDLKEHSPLTVWTSAKTDLKQCEESDSPSVIEFSALEVGRMVKITGKSDGSKYLAKSVIQY